MSIIVNMHEAKSNLSQLVLKAQAGEDIVVARSGVPVAKIVAYGDEVPPKRFGALRDFIPEISPEQWAESDRDLRSLWTQ